MTKNIPDFNSEDVISFGSFTIKCKDLQNALSSIYDRRSFFDQFNNDLRTYSVNISDNKRDEWGTGVTCEVLRLNDPTWRSGKIKLSMTLDFIPDDPEKDIEISAQKAESPLDEIRQMLDDN
jgi:hypothetical protein